MNYQKKWNYFLKNKKKEKMSSTNLSDKKKYIPTFYLKKVFKSTSNDNIIAFVKTKYLWEFVCWRKQFKCIEQDFKLTRLQNKIKENPFLYPIHISIFHENSLPKLYVSYPDILYAYYKMNKKYILVDFPINLLEIFEKHKIYPSEKRISTFKYISSTNVSNLVNLS